MYFNEFINQRRKELEMSVDDLVQRSGIPKGTVSKITSGISNNPTLSTVEALCKALGCTINEAVGVEPVEDITPIERNGIKKYRTLDEYGKKALHDLLETEYKRCVADTQATRSDVIRIKMSCLAASAGTGDPLENEEYDYITVKRTPEAERADYAIEVNGDSMEDSLHDGDIVLVESTPVLSIGDIGVFMLNGDGYVKEYGGDRLISHNEEYEDILLHDHDMVICSGKVIGIAELLE